MEDIEEIEVLEEVKPEIDQVEVDKLKEQIIEQIRYKNPRLYYKIKTGQDYHPWERTDNVEAGILGLRLHRNDLCKCGSNLKVKKCCGIKAYYTVPKVKEEEKKLYE